MCKGVLRNYVRPGIPLGKHILIIPLGYARGHGCSNNNNNSNNSRPHLWSFKGTAWLDREAKLESLRALNAPHKLTLRPNWDVTEVIDTEYNELLDTSKLIPCPAGNNIETYRFWEALEHGAIPLYVREQGDKYFWRWIEKHLPLQAIPSWNLAGEAAQIITTNLEVYEAYRGHLGRAWASWKATLCKTVREIMPL